MVPCGFHEADGTRIRSLEGVGSFGWKNRKSLEFISEQNLDAADWVGMKNAEMCFAV